MKHLLLTTIAAVVLVTTAFADPIHDAARDGALAGVQELLDAGADATATDAAGRTPLHYAADLGYSQIAELLISKGSNVNATNNFEATPLDFADGEIADLLLIHGGKTSEELKAEGK